LTSGELPINTRTHMGIGISGTWGPSITQRENFKGDDIRFMESLQLDVSVLKFP